MAPTVEQLMKSPRDLAEEAQKGSTKRGNLDQYAEIVGSLKKLSSKAEIHFFGSRVYGLSGENSDLDIFVDLANNFNGNSNQKLDADKLKSIENNLGDDWEVKVAILDAHVPVLQATYLPMKLECDIVASNGLGVMTSKFLKYLFDIQPEARLFYHFIQMWFDNYDLKLRNYLLTLLVVFYLQTQKLMPSTERVQVHMEEIIDGWNVAFDEKRKDITGYGTAKMTDFKAHLIGFFKFYGNYSFAANVISTHKGEPISRENYKQLYKDFKIEKPMCVAGPFAQDYNRGYEIEEERLEKFQKVCKETAAKLAENDFPK